jgi:hypothetical protein
MPYRFPLVLLLPIAALPLLLAHSGEVVAAAVESCVQCHVAERSGFGTGHEFAAAACSACHAGDPGSSIEEEAHDGMVPFPGDMATAERACGSCHANRVSGVGANLMHTGRGIVMKTRAAIDGEADSADHPSFQSLAMSAADSMLRKQCASCHLGQPKRQHGLDATRDRGGGCLACHINDYPDDAHPALTTHVDDGRCFGCHSRSGRISLSYAGLAEIPAPEDPGKRPSLRLADGRAVERRPADVHYLAGMSCIDCHTSVGLMADAGDAAHQREAVDIACGDCHGNTSTRIAMRDWPAELASMKKHVPFAANADTPFLVTAKNGTPLWHVQLRADGAWLHTKNTGRRLRIPEPTPGRHDEDSSHQRLACAACHSQWAPQCFGCHMEYDPDGEQWDHIDKRVTPGRWSDRFWHADNSLPALGVNERNAVEAFVPGMIMTVSHPDWAGEKFVRRFAPLSPHTSGASRSCESCHRSSKALGLGAGASEQLPDGLPADAWTNSDNSLGGRTPVPGQRPFNAVEMQSLRSAEIEGAN